MKYLSGFMTLLLAACGQVNTSVDSEFAVGANTYCIPAKRIIQAPPWVPNTPQIKEDGFAVTGCYWERTNESGSTCDDLISIGSFGVGPPTSHAFKKLGELPENTFYRTVTQESDTEIVNTANKFRLKVTNPRLSWLTFYWSRSQPDGRTNNLAMNDTLLFACERKKV